MNRKNEFYVQGGRGKKRKKEEQLRKNWVKNEGKHEKLLF